MLLPMNFRLVIHRSWNFNVYLADKTDSSFWFSIFIFKPDCSSLMSRNLIGTPINSCHTRVFFFQGFVTSHNSHFDVTRWKQSTTIFFNFWRCHSLWICSQNISADYFRFFKLDCKRNRLKLGWDFETDHLFEDYRRSSSDQEYIFNANKPAFV